MSGSIWPTHLWRLQRALKRRGFKLQQREIDAAVRELARLIARWGRDGRKVFVPGLGAFRPFERKERTFRNPTTGRPSVVPRSLTVKFNPSKRLRERMNKETP